MTATRVARGNGWAQSGQPKCLSSSSSSWTSTSTMSVVPVVAIVAADSGDVPTSVASPWRRSSRATSSERIRATRRAVPRFQRSLRPDDFERSLHAPRCRWRWRSASSSSTCACGTPLPAGLRPDAVSSACSSTVSASPCASFRSATTCGESTIPPARHAFNAARCSAASGSRCSSGLSGTSSISSPSGQSVGSSGTRRPFFTWP